MKTPTIKDIAREAGVSHGTVSNVLNGRGNVSVEKIRMVEDAADKLGYHLNAKAQVLRKGKKNAVLLIVPGTHYTGYSDLIEVFQKQLRDYGYTAQIYSTNSLLVEEKAAVDFAMMSRMAAVVAVMSPDFSNDCLQVAAREMQVVLVDNHVAAGPDILLAGFDHEKAGRDAATLLNEKNARMAGVFTGDMRATHLDAFMSGFKAEFLGRIKLVDSTDQLADVRAFGLFEGGEEYDGIVCSDELRREAVIRAHSFSGKGPLPLLISLSSLRAVTQSGALFYELDYKKLAYAIINRLLGGGNQELILPCSGFKTSLPSIVRSEEKLEFLTVNSPSSVALSCLLPHFREKSGIDLRLTVVDLEELYDMAHAIGPESKFDLVRMDMAWISELAPYVYAPMNSLPFDWKSITDNILPFFLDDYTAAWQTRYCLPYDPSTQLFFYRKDLFEDPTIKRMFYEMNRKELTIPQTFEDYNAVARFFTREYNPQSPVLYGTTAAIGNSAVSPSEYMLRLFGEGGSFFNEEGYIDLETPQAVNALQNYAQSYHYSDKTVYQWWKGALEGFARGAAAMTVVFMNYASDIINAQHSNVAGRIGFAMVPGKKPLIGGGVVGIAHSCKHTEAAFTFLQWLYSSEIAPVFTMLGGFSPCESVYENRDVLDLYPWLTAAKHSFPIGQRRLHNHHYMNFSEKKLEEIISIQVKNAVLGRLTPREALRHAQRECQERFIPII